MNNDIQNKQRRRMDLGWWGAAVILIALTIAEFTGAFALISKVSTLTTSWQWSPTGSNEVIGK